MDKPKLLIIAMMYSMEGATTSIIKGLSSLLKNYYDIDIATQNPRSAQNYETDNGIRIIRTPYYSFHKSLNAKRNSYQDLSKMLFYKLVGLIRNNDIEEKNAYFFIKNICDIANIHEYDVIMSVSAPFVSHYCASILSKKFNIPWIAYYFDPFFSNATLHISGVNNRKKIEEQVMSVAAKVIIAYPTNEDYLRRDVTFAEKIAMTDMPGIVYERYIDNVVSVHEDCGCYFIGNLYKDIRNPESVIKVFSLLPDKITMFFVGGWYGDSIDTRNLSSANVQFLGSKKEDEISAIYGDADILVNIGNAIDNQMPSKIFEYISTGKPILNIYKIPNCPTLKYLRKYPLALNIFEDDLVKDMDFYAAKIQDFCLENKGKRVPLEFIMENYQANTDENVAEFLRRQIDEVLEGQ